MPHSGCTQLYKHTKYRHTRSERKTICMLNQYSDKYSKRNIDIIKSFNETCRIILPQHIIDDLFRVYVKLLINYLKSTNFGLSRRLASVFL